jgi:hypothetical protein
MTLILRVFGKSFVTGFADSNALLITEVTTLSTNIHFFYFDKQIF